MAEMKDRLTHITQGCNPQIAQVNKMICAVSRRAAALRNPALLKEAELKQEELAAIAKADQADGQTRKELLALIARFDASEAGRALLEALRLRHRPGRRGRQRPRPRDAAKRRAG